MVSQRRKALEKVWRGRCNVIAWESYRDPITFVTKQGEVVKYTDIPCKKSVQKLMPTTNSGVAPVITEIIKLSLGNEYEIPAGCKIVLTQDGVTENYTRSGKPGRFMDHQEIVLELFKGWA